MGSLEPPTSTENGSATGAGKVPAADGVPLQSAEPVGMALERPQESDATRRRKASMLPLEVGTRVMCRWRDGKYHPVKVIERRKVQAGGPNDYEYYVHYTECKTFNRLFLWLRLIRLVRVSGVNWRREEQMKLSGYKDVPIKTGNLVANELRKRFIRNGDAWYSLSAFGMEWLRGELVWLQWL